ncbi:hypothetical protein L9F63_002427 [Diploptera punctata]|uniref:Cytosol aminopeptidase n=1 Tax=Diploptera punctata TaxID=6984 RepID=A0AAD8ECU4_DIPPU|nr:hypothetical protein L9F63_002427 [Diploptera punctata]
MSVISSLRRLTFVGLRTIRQVAHIPVRLQSKIDNFDDMECALDATKTRALVIGLYMSTGDIRLQELKFTPSAKKYNQSVNGELDRQVRLGGPLPKKGEARLFYGLDDVFNMIALVGLGDICDGYNEIEEIDESKEAIRTGVGVACLALQKHRINAIHVEDFGHAESAAEGAALGVWVYQELKNKSKQLLIPHLELHDSKDCTGWQIGLQKAAAQNLARQLMDTPANIMTPHTFAQNAVQILCNSGINVEVKVQGWAETQKMGAFLSVAKGSCESAIFLEISYYGTNFDERPIVLVGSGVTFDSGGLCLKKPENMQYMRGDMAGAAIVIATTRAIAHLQLPINIRGLIPLCESMPGCLALKPGEVVTAMNGKNILVESTQHDGRLVLADALYYAHYFYPRFIVDIGTISKDLKRSMADTCTGVFTNSDSLWEQIRMAGVHTGDRVWRFPLWEYFNKQVTNTESEDIRTMGHARGGGHCRAAAFLRHFVPCGEWLHLDIYGVMYADGRILYT